MHCTEATMFYWRAKTERMRLSQHNEEHHWTPWLAYTLQTNVEGRDSSESLR
jgi:hypothetical protein